MPCKSRLVSTCVQQGREVEPVVHQQDVADAAQLRDRIEHREDMASTTVAAIAPTGTSVSVEKNSAMPARPRRSTNTYPATPSERSKPLLTDTVSPDRSVMPWVPNSETPSTMPITVTSAIPATMKAITPAVFTASIRVRETGTVSKSRSVPVFASPATASPATTATATGKKTGRQSVKAATQGTTRCS